MSHISLSQILLTKRNNKNGPASIARHCKEDVMKQILRKYKRAGVTDYESANQAITEYIDKSEGPLKTWQLDLFAGVLDYVAENIEREAPKTRSADEWRELEHQYIVKADFTLTDLVDYLLRRLKKGRITREQYSEERRQFKPCKHRFCLNYYRPQRTNQEFCPRDCKEREKRALKEFEKTSKIYENGTYLPPSTYKTLRQAELEHLYRKHERKFDPVILTELMAEDEMYTGKRDKAKEERKNRSWKIEKEVEKGGQNHVKCEETDKSPLKKIVYL
jgi:hypothetical protein